MPERSAVIRAATTDDVAQLQSIEEAADVLFRQWFTPAAWPMAARGEERAATAGLILVTATAALLPAVGFVHVLEPDGAAHLEQLAVRPEHGRHGLGRALVGAALREAAARGHDRVTLRTYADVPWNAPFYARLGFVESQPDTAFLRGLIEVEERLGLLEFGRRVQMTADLPARRQAARA